MGEDNAINIQPGTVINNRYEVVRCLGTGSMGLVYACKHRDLGNHLVAMKVLFSNVARDEVAFARFKNEIVASYGVNHPNVVRAYEYFSEGDLVAYTMEYVDGGDLADRLNDAKLFTIDECVRLLKQTCAGLQAIHEAGIIHRDLKPENILLDRKGNVKITDLGIARTQGGPRLTEHGGVVGTMQYVSPEYLEEGLVDESSDIYALGVIAYEMIVGDEPFKGKTAIEQMTMRLRNDPEPLYLGRSDCPAPLSDIVLKAMARKPADRYRTAQEMLDDLSKFSRSKLELEEEIEKEESQATLAEDSEEYFSSGTIEMENTLLSKIKSEIGPSISRASRSVEKSELAQENDGYSAPKERQQREADRFMSNVSISQSRLSNDRIKELSRDFYSTSNASFFKSILFYLFFLVLGLSLALYGLYSVKPEFFGKTNKVDVVDRKVIR